MSSVSDRIAEIKRQLESPDQAKPRSSQSRPARYICTTCAHIKVDHEPDYKAAGTSCDQCSGSMSFTTSPAGRFAAITLLGEDLDECKRLCQYKVPATGHTGIPVADGGGARVCMKWWSNSDRHCVDHTTVMPEPEFTGTLF